MLTIGEGSLYPALHRLEERGWVDAEWRLSENNRRAKFYSLTTHGRRQLKVEADHWSRFTYAIGAVLSATEQPA
jgi:DNA-binding PadR family transcriptional regulator